MLGTRYEPASDTLSEAIVAWRAWTLAGSRDGSEARLLPIAGDGRPWPLLQPARASCRRHRGPVPDLWCTCGLHAVHDPDILRRTRDPAVIGSVALWGRVVEHANGFRAELGYPQRLRLACMICLWRRGGGARGPDVVVRHRGGRMVPLCDDDLALARRYGYRVKTLVPVKPVQDALLSAYAVDLLPAPVRLAPAPSLQG